MFRLDTCRQPQIIPETDFILDEAGWARDQDKLVPVLIRQVQLPLRFRGLHTLDLVGWQGARTFPGYDELVRQLTGLIGTPNTRAGSATGPETIDDSIAHEVLMNDAAVKKIYISRQDNQTIYAGTSEGLYFSNNAGTTWLKMREYFLHHQLIIIQQQEQEQKQQPKQQS